MHPCPSVPQSLLGLESTPYKQRPDTHPLPRRIHCSSLLRQCHGRTHQDSIVEYINSREKMASAAEETSPRSKRRIPGDMVKLQRFVCHVQETPIYSLCRKPCCTLAGMANCSIVHSWIGNLEYKRFELSNWCPNMVSQSTEAPIQHEYNANFQSQYNRSIWD